MGVCKDCYFYSSSYMWNGCSYFNSECFIEPKECLGFSIDGNLSKEIENKIAIDTNNSFGKRMKCGTCKHYIGAGDWNLCCDIKHEEYPFGFLCYEDTDACDKYEKRNKHEEKKN